MPALTEGARVRCDCSYTNYRSRDWEEVELFIEGTIERITLQEYDDIDECYYDVDYPYFVALDTPDYNHDSHRWFEEGQLEYIGKRTPKAKTGLANFIRRIEDNAL